jgi:hypothetical protein
MHSNQPEEKVDNMNLGEDGINLEYLDDAEKGSASHKTKSLTSKTVSHVQDD